MKPHIFAQMVNEVRDLARQYGQVEQFRCRVADLLGKYIPVEHNLKGMPEQTEAQAVMVPELTTEDLEWCRCECAYGNWEDAVRAGWERLRSRLRVIPADRVLGERQVAVDREELDQLWWIEDPREWHESLEKLGAKNGFDALRTQAGKDGAA